VSSLLDGCSHSLVDSNGMGFSILLDRIVSWHLLHVWWVIVNVQYAQKSTTIAFPNPQFMIS
jgi:hypothetical protein